jgi:CheY-like chemotaxis protein/HPt (histidine-containing phosphotransfer) domain-containing protein
VLVAEDSPLNQQVALKQLEKLGCTAEAVNDGSQVFEALGRTHFDIILMDCQMPEMSGYEATWQIRNREKQSAGEAGRPRLYIIAMTANTAADNREKCRAAGMDDFINKPVQLPELEAALHRAMADRAAQQALEEVIDPVIIAGLRQLRTPGKPDVLGELVDLFFKEAPDRLDAIEKAIARNDVSSMALTLNGAAALKGIAGNLGARNLAALCEEIEQSAKTGLLSDALPLLEKARQEFDRVREALAKIKGET